MLHGEQTKFFINSNLIFYYLNGALEYCERMLIVLLRAQDFCRVTVETFNNNNTQPAYADFD